MSPTSIGVDDGPGALAGGTRGLDVYLVMRLIKGVVNHAPHAAAGRHAVVVIADAIISKSPLEQGLSGHPNSIDRRTINHNGGGHTVNFGND